MEKEEKSAQGDKSRESLNAPAALLTDCKHKMERTVQKNNYQKICQIVCGDQYKKTGIKRTSG